MSQLRGDMGGVGVELDLLRLKVTEPETFTGVPYL